MAELFIGLMSGTSLDGIDGVLADFSVRTPKVLAHVARPFSENLRVELLALNARGEDELHRAALAGNALARAYAAVVAQLLADTGTEAAAVLAIGAHGQTVRHRPGLYDATGYTLQINQPALLAELSGIAVVADFRSRDVAAGGQGAPLVPAFHAGVFARPGEAVAVLNIGGIANLSLLGTDGSVQGFDCGPGNALMDHWCQKHTGHSFDDQGEWAASGQVCADLLARLLDEPFLSMAPPKSTGRDLFNPPWLHAHLARWPDLRPADVQATLAEYTAQACAQALRTHAGDLKPASLVVCGGGALNGHLMSRLRALLPALQVETSAAWGMPPLQVEATAFAWLARQCLHREPAGLPAVTGARAARVLGAVYPR